MSNSYKRTVSLESIVSSDLNARRDFSDVAELAEAIRATGGQPVNPIAVRPMRDGTFRVIDGERRLRALRSIGAEMTDVVVYPETSDATEALAVLATDSKRRLDGTEVMRAYQQVLDLDVDDERVALAVVIDADVVRRTRRVPRKLITEQTTLDALIAAADDEFSEEEREQIIKQGERKYGDPGAEADRIRAMHDKDRCRAVVRDALTDEFNGDVEFHDTVITSYGARVEGLVYVGVARDAKAVARLAKGDLAEVTLQAYKTSDGKGYEVYRPASDADKAADEAAEADVKRVRDEHVAAYERAYAEMCKLATAPWCSIVPGTDPARRRPNLCKLVMTKRFTPYPYDRIREMEDILGTQVFDRCKEDDPSLLEVCAYLARVHRSNGLLGWDGKVSGSSSEEFAGLYDALAKDACYMGDEAKALRAMCPETDAEENDDDDAE